MSAIQGIGQIAVNTRDTARATAFYRDVVGLRFLFAAGPDLAFFDCGGVRLMLSRPSEAKFDHPGSILYYKVADLTAVHASMVKKGATVESEPHLIARMPDHELWMGFYADTEGNTFALMEEKR